MVAHARAEGYVQAMDMTPPPAIAQIAPMSSRLVVMMTAHDKQAIEARARALDLSTSEFVRQAAAAYDERVSPEEERLLEALADEFEAAVAAIRKDLREAIERSDAHFVEMAAIKSAPPPVIDLDDDQLAALAQIFGGVVEERV